MAKILLLTIDENAYYFNKVDPDKIEIAPVFSKHAMLSAFLEKTVRKLGRKESRFFYGSWYKRLSEFTKIIVFDAAWCLDSRLLENITKKNPQAERYIYSWNISKNEEKTLRDRQTASLNGFQYYCYDRKECQKFHFHFNTIMYEPDLKLPVQPEQFDLLFLGFVKDRKEKMVQIYDKFVQAGLCPKFVAIDKTGDLKQVPFDVVSNYVNYYDYLNLVSQSKCILDIAQEGQDGYSMRVMEALFFDKKLITTNSHIKDASFYNENNILIIESESFSVKEVEAFYKKELIPYPASEKKYYSIYVWADRFN